MCLRASVFFDNSVKVSLTKDTGHRAMPPYRVFHECNAAALNFPSPQQIVTFTANRLSIEAPPLN